jgi:putative phosphoribosyl transferase
MVDDQTFSDPEITPVSITLQNVTVEGFFTVPRQAQGLVIFVHGSGSSRLSPRNQFVARVLHRARLATLLADLLTEAEDRDYKRRFDIPLLTDRVLSITDWAKQHPAFPGLPIGYFGASTGAAAALQAAVELGEEIKAIVSRGGRPDLATELEKVTAPTLLIVGGNDYEVIRLNQKALAALRGRKELQIVPGATHLFEEPGTLEQVAELSAQWFTKELSASKEEL